MTLQKPFFSKTMDFAENIFKNRAGKTKGRIYWVISGTWKTVKTQKPCSENYEGGHRHGEH